MLYPKHLVGLAFWLYSRSSSSYRGIEDILAEMGMTVMRESIRLWCVKFGAI
jgi:putative transposase